MSKILGVDRNVVVLSAACAASVWAGFATYKYLKLRREKADNVYESRKLLHEYLVFHYGKPQEILKWDFGPHDALDFPKRCADVCMEYFPSEPGVPKRALDIGCAVGRSSFELTRAFDEVLGIDFSHSFVQACCQLKEYGEMLYDVLDQGELVTHLMAQVSKDLDRSKANFQQGDACNLPLNLGQFGCVLAANLICRLPTPQDFLDRLASLVAPGGIAVITSPYSFMTEYTPRKNWIGGYREDGVPFTGMEGLHKALGSRFELVGEQQMPFFIRETERKNQWTVAHTTIWKRKRDS